MIDFPVLIIFLSDWYHHQCMGHISVVTTVHSGELLLCENWCTETTSEDHRHALVEGAGLPFAFLLTLYRVPIVATPGECH